MWKRETSQSSSSCHIQTRVKPNIDHRSVFSFDIVHWSDWLDVPTHPQQVWLLEKFKAYSMPNLSNNVLERDHLPYFRCSNLHPSQFKVLGTIPLEKKLMRSSRTDSGRRIYTNCVWYPRCRAIWKHYLIYSKIKMSEIVTSSSKFHVTYNLFLWKSLYFSKVGFFCMNSVLLMANLY